MSDKVIIIGAVAIGAYLLMQKLQDKASNNGFPLPIQEGKLGLEHKAQVNAHIGKGPPRSGQMLPPQPPPRGQPHPNNPPPFTMREMLDGSIEWP